MKKKKHEEETENTDRWLLTYADLITLLLGLFVILYAMSKIDVGKYKEMVAALGGVFGSSSNTVIDGGKGVLQPLLPASQLRDQMKQEIQKALSDASRKNLISVSQNERGITVHIMDELLFSSGSAEFKQGSLLLLDTLAGILATLPNDIRIEGHTDDVPINTLQFPSNWHLSVARAVNTGYFFLTQRKINPEKISVVGYSEYHPLVSNTSAENRAKNRRVDIVILNMKNENKNGAKEENGSSSQR